MDIEQTSIIIVSLWDKFPAAHGEIKNKLSSRIHRPLAAVRFINEGGIYNFNPARNRYMVEKIVHLLAGYRNVLNP